MKGFDGLFYMLLIFELNGFVILMLIFSVDIDFDIV